MDSRKLILYIACSLDGFIAGPGDDLSFLDELDHGGADYGYPDFIKTVDTVIVGRKTYDWVINQGHAWPHPEEKTYVITRTERPSEGNVEFYTGDLGSLIATLKAEEGINIFCDGGAGLVNALLQQNLIDELIVSVTPTLLGEGVRLFADGRPKQLLKLLSSKAYDSGIVVLHYAAHF